MRTIILLAITMVVCSGLVGAQEVPEVDERVSAVLKQIKSNEPPKWSYGDLESKSDLIVIATVIESRVDNDNTPKGLDYDSEVVDRVVSKVKCFRF